jgi:hypothetical protein
MHIHRHATCYMLHATCACATAARAAAQHATSPLGSRLSDVCAAVHCCGADPKSGGGRAARLAAQRKHITDKMESTFGACDAYRVDMTATRCAHHRTAAAPRHRTGPHRCVLRHGRRTVDAPPPRCDRVATAPHLSCAPRQLAPSEDACSCSARSRRLQVRIPEGSALVDLAARGQRARQCRAEEDALPAGARHPRWPGRGVSAGE